MICPRIKLKLNNNPACEAEIESTVKHQIWNLYNRPYILLEGDNFEDGITEINVTGSKRELYRGEIDIIDGNFALKFELDNILNDVKYIEVTVGKKEFSIPIELKRLYGTVKYYDDIPVKNPIINCRLSDILSVGDELGNFEIFLNSSEKDIGVFDTGYSKDTLESWLYNVDLKEDLELDIKMHKAEVYGINMWRQYASDYIHFVPMSLTRSLEVMKRGFNDEVSLASCEDAQCTLSKDDVKIYRDGDIMEIVSFNEVKDFLGRHDDKSLYRNSYVACIPRGSKDDRVVKIVINSRFNVNGEEIIDKGEGYYIIK